MDRGGFGQSRSASVTHRFYSRFSINIVRYPRNGTNFGCVFDGVTAGGKINAMAAQAFAEFTVDWLLHNHTKFKHTGETFDLLLFH